MTQPFLESPRFPDDLGVWAQGGVSYNTTVVTSSSGREQRNVMWNFGRGQWDLQSVDRTNTGLSSELSVQYLRTLFRACKGQAYGFRFRDATDYTDEGAGVLGSLVGNFTSNPAIDGSGAPVYQMYKFYFLTPLVDYRAVQKPLSPTVALLRNSAPVTQGTAPGNAEIDYTTGLVTFAPDYTENITSITVSGTSFEITLAAALGSLGVGGVLVPLSVSNDPDDLLNGQPLTITAVSGDVYTVTAPGTIPGGYAPSGGTANSYPQPGESLTWTGMFDTPVRFATDVFAPAFDGEGGFWTFQSLSLVEIRL